MEAALASEEVAEVPSPDTVESEETHSGPETPEPQTPAALDAPLVKETIVTPGHEEPSVVPNVEEVPIKVPTSVVADTTPRKYVPQSCFVHERYDHDAQLLYFLYYVLLHRTKSPNGIAGRNGVSPRPKPRRRLSNLVAILTGKKAVPLK